MQPTPSAPVSPQQDPSTQPVEPWLVRAAGFVLFCIGVLLSALLAWGSYRVATSSKTTDSTVFIVGAVLLPIALFCCVAGFRLLFNLPNRYGSILPPTGWYAIAGVSVALAACVAVASALAGRLSDLIGVVCMLAFASWCVRAGRRLKSL